MHITKGIHKSTLISLFYDLNPRAGMGGQPPFIAKEFPLEKLFDASSAKKKLMPIVKEATNEEIKDFCLKNKISEEEAKKQGLKTSIFEDKSVELSLDEAMVLKELFDAKKNWSIDEAETVKELKDIFYPPQ